MTENKSQKSKPSLSISIPHDQKEVVLAKLKALVADLKPVPGTLVESQSELFRTMVMGSEMVKEGDDFYLKFKVIEGVASGVD